MLPVERTSIYFDNNATTQISPSVRKVIRKTMRIPLGNPSSPHHFADISRDIIQQSRNIIAKFLKCTPQSIIFTSGATEANSMLLQSLQKAKGERTLVTSVSEHASVSNNAEFLKEHNIRVISIDVSSSGLIDEKQYLEALQREGTVLVSIGWVNSETGIIQDIERLASLAKAHGAIFHTDASQAVGRIPIDLRDKNIDFLTLAGHKLHAPKGIGVLVSRNNKFLHSLLIGGEQEKELRAGTENVLHIAALGAAIERRAKKFDKIVAKLKNMRNFFEASIISSIEGVSINGDTKRRVPNTTNLLFKGLPAQALLARLDGRGVYCSQTSACTSMIPEPSKILRAMGLSEEDAFSSYRFSFAENNTMREVRKAVKIIKQEVNHLQNNPIWRDI